MYRKAVASIFGLGFTLWLAVIAINATVGGLCLQYDVAFWSRYFMHVEKHLPFVPAAVAGVFVSPIAISVALATWVLSFIL